MILFGGKSKYEPVVYTIGVSLGNGYLNGFTRLNRGISIKGKVVHRIPYNYDTKNNVFTYESNRELKPEDITLDNFSPWQWFNIDPIEKDIRSHATKSGDTITINSNYISTYTPTCTVKINEVNHVITVYINWTQSNEELNLALIAIDSDPTIEEYGPFYGSISASGIASGSVRTSNTMDVNWNNLTRSVSLGLRFENGYIALFRLWR